jgi:hypothetical protein
VDLKKPRAFHTARFEANYTVKKVTDFLITKLSMAGNNLIIPARESLVSDIPAGDRKIINLFFQCMGPAAPRHLFLLAVYTV